MRKRAEELIVSTARVADRQGRFHRPPGPGCILVIDSSELSYDLANTLAAYRPAAVLTSGKSSSNRGVGLGSGVLLDAGVTVLDDLGPDLMEVRDGQEIAVSPSTGEVIRSSELIASGRTITGSDVADQLRGARQTLATRVESQALSAAHAFERESGIVLSGAGLPPASKSMIGRVALVVPPSAPLKTQRREVRRLVGEYHPVIIAVGTGAAVLSEIGLRPTVLVGDPREFEPSALRRARQVLVPGGEGEVPGQDLLKRYSVAYDSVTTGLSDPDVAMLFAAHNGASTIVNCAAPATLEEILDGPAQQRVGNALVAARLRDRLVSLPAALALYRQRISGWWVAALVLDALLVGLAALVFTPWGSSVIGLSAAGLPLVGVRASRAADTDMPVSWPEPNSLQEQPL